MQLFPNYTQKHVITYRLHTKGKVAKSLGNQARGVQPACTMTTQNSKIRLISSIALKSRLITYLDGSGHTCCLLCCGYHGNKNDAISLFSLLAVKFQIISLVSVVSMAASEMQ